MGISDLPRGVAYTLITLATIAIYLLVFAHALPWRRQLLAVGTLAVSTYILWFFHNRGAPVFVVLVCTLIVIAIVRLRLWLTVGLARRKRHKAEKEKKIS